MYFTTIFGEWILSCEHWFDLISEHLRTFCTIHVHYWITMGHRALIVGGLKVRGPSLHSTHCWSYPAFGSNLMGCIVNLSGNLEARNIVWSIFTHYFPEIERAESFDSLTIFDYLTDSYVWNLKQYIYWGQAAAYCNFFFGRFIRPKMRANARHCQTHVFHTCTSV